MNKKRIRILKTNIFTRLFKKPFYHEMSNNNLTIFIHTKIIYL